MKLEIKVLDDNDQVVAEYTGDPCQPGQWRAQVGKAVSGKMPTQSDNQNTGTYTLYGFTYQPHVQIERPNGYTAPVPGPNNGPAPPPFGYLPPRPKPSLWGPQRTPTAAPAPSAQNNPLQGTKIL